LQPFTGHEPVVVARERHARFSHQRRRVAPVDLAATPAHRVHCCCRRRRALAPLLPPPLSF